MSRIEELKQMPSNRINIIEILSLLCPDKKVKYVEMLLKIMKSSESLSTYKQDCIEGLEKDYNITADMVKNLDALQIIHMKDFLDNMFDLPDLQQFQKFAEYNERNLIPDNDVSRYTKFEQLKQAVSVAELKINEKLLETQIIRAFENDEWLVIRPLTYEASKKYGANTKWCTTSESDSAHFDRYSKGVLVYCINKKINLKVAAYKDLSGEEFSFWDAAYKKIDSMESDLPFEVLGVIRDEVKKGKSNSVLTGGKI
jgi:hypothetical protein